MDKHVVIVGNACLINDVSFGEKPQIFLVPGFLTHSTGCFQRKKKEKKGKERDYWELCTFSLLSYVSVDKIVISIAVTWVIYSAGIFRCLQFLTLCSVQITFG